MFWKKKKPKNKFTQLKEEIEMDLERRRLASAMAMYNDFLNTYEKFNDQAKEFYRGDFFQTQNKLMLLLKVDELLQMIKTNELEEIKERLNEIENLTQNQIETIPERLFNHVKHHYNQAYKIYQYRIIKAELDKKLKKVHDLLTEQNYDIALKFFPEIRRLYNQSAFFHPDDNLLRNIEELKAHIKMSLLKQGAYTDEAQTDLKKLRIFLDKKEEKAEEKKKAQKIKIKLRNVEPKMKKLEKLRDSIEKGHLNKSKKEFYKAFNE